MERTVYVITGPTASGKTEHSLRFAKEHACEIVCMDSMQIYRRMDIGTAKPTPEERALVPHHMLDVAEPTEAFSVTRWLDGAAEAIEAIHARGKDALLVGGTGFYFRALRHPMAMGGTAGDEALRAEMQREADREGGRERLHAMLAAADPETAARLHVNDVRRVIRALEIVRLTGVPMSRQRQEDAPPRWPVRAVVFAPEREVLYRRIDRRVDRMLADGLAGEVRALLDSGVPEDCQAMKGLGYKEMVPYLRGACSLEEAADSIRRGSRHYAKRQLTWMRREEDVLWVDSLAPDAYEKTEAWLLSEEEH